MSKGDHARTPDQSSAAPHPDIPAQQNVAKCSSAPLTSRHLQRYVLDHKELSERQKNAALLLLRGASDSDVARQAGVDRMTIARWRKTPSFRRVFEAQRSTVWRNSVARLHELIDPALDILEKQLAAGDARTAMRAASILLRLAGPARVPRVSLDADDEDP